MANIFRIRVPLAFVIVLLIAAIGGTVFLTNKSGLDITIVNFENFSIASFFQPDPYGDIREGYFEKEYKGARVWSKIPNDLWIELYPESSLNIFHLYRKIRLDTVNGCDGEILQRVSIQTLNDKGRMYSYGNSPSLMGHIFMPKNIECSSNILHRYNDKSQWEKLFTVSHR